MSDVAQFFSDIIAGVDHLCHHIYSCFCDGNFAVFELPNDRSVMAVCGALIGLIHFSQVEPGVLIQPGARAFRQNALIAVPMFILAADIMTRGHTAYRKSTGLIQAFIWTPAWWVTDYDDVSALYSGSVSGSTQATVVSVSRHASEVACKQATKTTVMALIINASDIGVFLFHRVLILILYRNLSQRQCRWIIHCWYWPGFSTRETPCSHYTAMPTA